MTRRAPRDGWPLTPTLTSSEGRRLALPRPEDGEREKRREKSQCPRLSPRIASRRPNGARSNRAPNPGRCLSIARFR